MSFSRWYPVSSYYYDPAIQPTKAISNAQSKDDSQSRKIPKGRYDTTYRREYLNFNNGLSTGSNIIDKFENNPGSPPIQQGNDKSILNPYQILPPINGSQQNFMQQPSNNNYMTEDSSNYSNNISKSDFDRGQQMTMTTDKSNDFLPIDPVFLDPQEEQSLISNVCSDLSNFNSNQLKNMYTELTRFDPNLTGYVNYNYISLISAKHNLSLNESLMRFIMSRYVSSKQPGGSVNYEEFIKFIAKCLGQTATRSNQMVMSPRQAQYQSPFPSSPRMQTQYPNPNRIVNDSYDPDEQAILRLMHENMREWDQVNLIDCDNLRVKFHEIDPYNSYVLSQREIEDVLYKNRIPIQRSLTFQILEKYSKVSTGQYRWPAFVDFLEKVHNLRLPNKKKTTYNIREIDEKDNNTSQFTYRIAQLDSLRSKASEEERLDQINKQIYNLQNMRQETQPRNDSRLDNYVKDETWFTRFMRLANAMYSHRINAGIEFSMPKDDARSLITAYNSVYDLNMSNEKIEDGLNRCTLKGNVKIDDLLKYLSKI